MAKVYGQLENAQIENKSSDYSAGVTGRIWWNSTALKAMLDDGTNIRALIRNDQKLIIGNNGTAASNVRINRAAAGVLQFVVASDVTAEGSLSTSLAQISARIENYTTATLPAAASAGRLLWDTDLSLPKVDTGAAIKQILTNDGTQTLTNKTIDTALNTIKSGAELANKVLTANGLGGTSWNAVPVAALALAAKTANYTLLSTDDYASGDATGGTFNFTLLSAVGLAGKVFYLKKIDASTNAIGINTTGGQTIDGVSTKSLTYQNEVWAVISDGANWFSLSRNTARDMEIYTSTQVTTRCTAVSSGSFATTSDSPAFTFTPKENGVYKVWAPMTVITSGASVVASTRVVNTSGGATLLSESQGVFYSSTGEAGGSAFCVSTFTLTAGVAYVFDIQIKVGSGSARTFGDFGPFYMYAERMG